MPNVITTELWALVRFPNWNNVVRVLPCREISHSLQKSGSEVEYRPMGIKDFNICQPYRIATACDAVDNLVHEYYIQIHSLSFRKDHLEQLVKGTPTKKRRLKWTKILDFPKDPETDCETQHRLGSGALLPTQRDRAAASRSQLQNQNDRLQSTLSSMDQLRQTNSAEEDLRQEIARLQGKLRKQEEELQIEKQKNFAADDGSTITILKTEMALLFHQQKQALQEEMMKQFQQYKTEMKEELNEFRSGLSNTSGSISTTTSSAITWTTLPCGLRIRSGFETTLENCATESDFKHTLLWACFEDPKKLRTKGEAKFSQNWLASAETIYQKWLDKHSDRTLVEKRRMVKALAADLSKINQNKDVRGVNRVKKEAREKGEDPEAAAAAWRAANPNLKRAGGRPKKGSSSVSKRSRADSGIADTREEAHHLEEQPDQPDQPDQADQPPAPVASTSGATGIFTLLTDKEIGPGPPSPKAVRAGGEWTSYDNDGNESESDKDL